MELTLVELNNEKKDGAFRFDEGIFHHYLPTYDKLFTPFRNKEINLFEVGYGTGGSSKLWERYFSKGRIVSIDADCGVVPPITSRIELYIININNVTPEFFTNFKPDIAIDDGSHNIYEQVLFVKLVYPVLKEGGIIAIEDIQNLDVAKVEFKKLGIPFEIIDLRSVEFDRKSVPPQYSHIIDVRDGFGRYDDILLIFRK